MSSPISAPVKLTAQVEEAFGAISDNFGMLLSAAVRFAKPDGRDLVVDIEALVLALLTMKGVGTVSNASDWIREWASAQGYRFAQRKAPDTSDLEPTLSRSILGNILPRTAEIRDKTMAGKPERLSLRHLLYALAEYSPSSWPRLEDGKHPSSESLAALRAQVSAYVAKNPAKVGEDSAAWLALEDQAPETAVSPSLPETTPLLSDNPSSVDLLGRQPLVQALAIRLRRLQAEEAASVEPAAVMVHLHGAWGSGKSSMVKLLRQELEKRPRPWLVVEFNVWRHARVKPPWWNMLLAIKNALLKDAWLRGSAYPAPPLAHWFWLKGEFAVWRLRQDATAFAVALAALLCFGALWMFGSATHSPSDPILKSIKEWTGIVGSVFAGVYALRVFLLGGKPTAESFEALRTDAFRPFIEMFEKLVDLSGKPIIIVLDDLDRCDAGIVTDLLEGIQTLFRGAPVVFLAVADRRWITASFAKRFTDFQEASGDAARPVGDLFLDKMFQLSVGVPHMRPELKQSYVRQLLELSDKPPPPQPPPLPPELRSFEAGLDAIAAASVEQKPAVAAQVALRMAEPLSDIETRHKLEEYVRWMESNPRAVKRLINAIGMAKTVASVEQRFVKFDTLVLWTMLELGWPHVIEAIRVAPEAAKAAKSSPAKPASSAGVVPSGDNARSGGESQEERAGRLLANALQDPRFRAIWTELSELGMGQMLTEPLPPEDQ